MDWPPSSSVAWSRRLECVLADRTALDAFRSWLTAAHSAQPLELHFAMRAYVGMAMERHQKTMELARSIYSRYISLRTGCCDFLPPRLRQEIGQRVKHLSFEPDARLFEPCAPFVDDFLRRQHAQFCHSEEFVDAFNRVHMEDCSPKRHSSVFSSSLRRDPRAGSGRKSRVGPASFSPAPLTADALIKSQQHREKALGESEVERLYPSAGPRYPYVCRATTSHNDSAVSSSFSSEAHSSHSHPRGGGHRLSSIREEHLRGNPVTITIPRVDPLPADGDRFQHENEPGRREFVAALTRRLNKELARRSRNDQTERQLRDIRDNKCSAREVVNRLADPAGEEAEDDDVDAYLERMRDDSLKASADRSPHSPKPCFSPVDKSSPGGALAPPPLAPPPPAPSHAMSASFTYQSNGFAPPPRSFVSYKERPLSSYTTSGFESLGTASLGSAPPTVAPPTMASRHSNIMSYSMSETPRERRHRSRGPPGPLVTVSYKCEDGVPVVAHVSLPPQGLTLREFRRLFSISSHARMQFFFKTTCEDGSSPYQLLLINDDCELLPLFDGKITAECKQGSVE